VLSDWLFSWFVLIPPGKCFDSNSVTPRPNSFKYSPLRHSSTMLNFDVVLFWVTDSVVKRTTKTKHLPTVCNLRKMQGICFPLSISLRIVKGSNRSKATVGVVSPGVHCHTLNGPATDLWLLVCVHTTCGWYENFKSANTHCGCHLT